MQIFLLRETIQKVMKFSVKNCLIDIGVPLTTALGRVIQTKVLAPRGINNKQAWCQ